MESVRRTLQSLCASGTKDDQSSPAAASGKTTAQSHRAPHPIPKGSEDATCPISGMSPQAMPQTLGGPLDLTKVRNDIHAVMYNPSHDDGSYAPLLIRFAWHLCGTYDKQTKTGGSNGGTMRFEAEANDPENAGFDKAKALLAPIHEKHAWLSYADLCILAGYVAIEAAGGSRIRFSHGRKDFSKEQAVAIYGRSGCPFGDGKFNPHGSRLPAADLGPDPNVHASAPMCQREAPTINAMRSTFSRMGLNDCETVALLLFGHQFGRCHREVSGYEGPWWGRDPTTVNSDGVGYLHCIANYDWEYEENPCANAKPIDPNKKWPAAARGRNFDLWPAGQGSCSLAPAHRLLGSSWSQAVRPHPTLAAGKRQYDNTGNGRHLMMLIADMCLTWDPQYKQQLQRYRQDRRAFGLEAMLAWKKLTELGCDGLLVEEATPLN